MSRSQGYRGNAGRGVGWPDGVSLRRHYQDSHLAIACHSGTDFKSLKNQSKRKRFVI